MTKYSMTDGRLTAHDKLSAEDFRAIAQAMGVAPGYARKIGDKPVAAMRIATEVEIVKTINTKDGSVQATKTAQVNDSIMTRLNKDGSVKRGATGQPDQWAVDAANAAKLFTRLGGTCDYGDVVGGNNMGWFIQLANGGDIVAPWGGRQQTTDGVLFLSETTDEVYLNEADSFTTFIVEKAQA